MVTMRMYAVVTPPPHALADLADAVRRAAAQAPGVPWLPQQAWHLKLGYFGNLGLGDSVAVRRTLEQVGSYCPPLSLRLVGVEATPDDAAADTLTVGLDGSIDELWSLARAIPAMVQRHGLFLDRRSFRTSITVAEGARGTFDARRATGALAAYQGVAWVADRMRVVRWRPGSDGEEDDWEDVEHYAFAAPHPGLGVDDSDPQPHRGGAHAAR